MIFLKKQKMKSKMTNLLNPNLKIYLYLEGLGAREWDLAILNCQKTHIERIHRFRTALVVNWQVRA